MSTPFTATDEAWMRHALDLAARGAWTSKPNPMVGCVLVAGDTPVGEGWHQWAGREHAEILALAAAGERARGATAYVTLEPCGRHGRTPPCVDALIAAGVARVVLPAPIRRNATTATRHAWRCRWHAAPAGCGHPARAACSNAGVRAQPRFFCRCRRPWLRIKLV